MVTVARRNTKSSLAVIAALAVIVVAGSATTAQAACGPGAGRALLGARAGALTAERSGKPTATTSIAAKAVAEWLGARAGVAIAEKTVVMGLDAILRAAGHKTVNDRILDQIHQIRGHLDDISGRIGGVENRLNVAIGEGRQRDLNNALRPLCKIVHAQENLFDNYYAPLVRGVDRLAKLLTSRNPKVRRLADVDDGTQLSPRERVEWLLPRFLNQASRLQTGFVTLHNALIPNNPGTSVIASYGLVLMSKRFLTRADSQKLRRLYNALADARALATWMSAEFLSGEVGSRHKANQRLETLVNNNIRERRELPPMIPPGVVIDLGDDDEEQTNVVPAEQK